MEKFFRIYILKSFFLSLLFSILNFSGFGEGTKQLRPDSTISGAGLYVGNFGGSYAQFAIMNCAPNNRLYIHVKNAGESILMGFGAPDSYNMQFNLRKPNGNIALSGSIPYTIGQTGYIRYFRQTSIGPFPLNGGYTPLQYTIANIADTGNYYFEFSNASSFGASRIDLYDFQVVSGAHSPAIPTDTINGRVWSQSWQFYADLAGPYQPFNAKFFVYSDDGIVTKLTFSDAHVGAVTIFCNAYGCLNTNNFTTDRQSSNYSTFNSFPGIAQYKVFLNNPDPTLYPDGTYGQIVGTPYMIPDPNFPSCSGKKYIVVQVDKAGKVDVNLSFPYGGNSTMVSLVAQVIPGINNIPWDGKDGLGNTVPSGTLVTVTVNFVNGLTNLPIWDQESNPNGFLISLIRPVSPSGPYPTVYWDDSQLLITGMCPYPPQNTNFSGCLPGSLPGYTGCHPWDNNQPDCHDKTINTWWYGSSSTATFTDLYIAAPPAPTGQDDTRCGAGSLVLHATVLPGETVDWYDSITGGALLLAGNTTFITPVINVTTTYYAETRSDTGGCTSSSRTPVVATILPAVVPTITGNREPCTNSGTYVYFTEPGMSNYLWDVSPGGAIVTGQGTDHVTVYWGVSGNLWISVNYTNASGCQAQQPVRVNILALEIPGDPGNINGTSIVCAGTDSVIYFVQPLANSFIYHWTVPQGAHIAGGAGTNLIHVNFGLNAQSGVITVSGVNHCGEGVLSPPFPVTVNQPVQSSAGPDVTLCQGRAFHVSEAYATNYSSLLWIHNGNGTLSNNTTLSPTYAPAPADSFPVTLTLIAHAFQPCIDDSSQMTINYIPLPVVFAGGNQSSCGSSPIVITGANARHYSSIHWTTSGSGTFNDPTLIHPQYTPGISDMQNGHAILTLSALGFDSCGSDTSSKLVHLAYPAIANAGTDSSICEGNQFIMNKASCDNFQSVYWTTTGDGFFNDRYIVNPIYVPGESDISKGFVNLFLTAFPNEPCSPVSDSVKLIITPGPKGYAGVDDTICQGGIYHVTGATAENYSSILWTQNGQGTLTGETTLTPTYFAAPLEVGYSNLTLKVTGIGNCSDLIFTDKRRIIINRAITADAGQDFSINSGKTAILHGSATGGSGFYHYSWEPSSFLTGSNTDRPETVKLITNKTFYLMVSDLYSGCLGTDSIKIWVLPPPDTTNEECLIIHNVITPNGDGSNDLWIIDCIEDHPENRVVLFDRWGDQINSLENYNNSTVVWNGTNAKNEPVPDGTYYYILSIKNGKTYKGWVLVRAGTN